MNLVQAKQYLGIFLLVMAFAVPAMVFGAGKAPGEVRSIQKLDKQGKRFLRDVNSSVIYRWEANHSFDGKYVINIIVGFVEDQNGKIPASGVIDLLLGKKQNGQERRSIRLRDRMPFQIVLEPTYVGADGILEIALMRSPGKEAFFVTSGSIGLERWSHPLKIYSSRRAVKAIQEKNGLYCLKSEGDRIHFRFSDINVKKIVRLVGAARIPFPVEGQLVVSRRILVGVGNRLGGMRYEYPMWLPGAKEQVPVRIEDVNLLGTIDIVLGWADGGPLLLGPQDVWLELYFSKD